MIEITRALKIIERETTKLGVERVALGDLVGRVLAENVVADSDLPPFDRSQMDGYAVVASHTADAPVTLRIAGESAAGRGWHRKMERGQAVRIMTGAPIPVGANAVQKVELTSGWSDDTSDTVTILETVKKGSAIVRKGAEVKKGKLIFRSGEVVTEQMISALASFGYARVRVGKVPRIAIMSTGTEIVPVNKKPGRDQIRNSNSVMLDVHCRKLGCPTAILPVATDDLAALKAAIRSSRCDVLIVTGGVSVGKYDLTKQALTELGAEIFFEKVSLKPGKPAVFARLGKMLIFGLPGNPVSAAVTFQIFVRKAIMLIQSAKETNLPGGNAILTADAKAPAERDAYIPASLSTDSSGYLLATPLRSQGSSDLIGSSRTDSLIVIKRGVRKGKGEAVEIYFL